jgi:hypothetical protein
MMPSVRMVTLSAVAALSMAGVAHANLVANGDFGTGDFTDWTLFTTPNGTLGAAPEPDVSSFNVTGGGAQNAATFNVGEVNFDGTEQGGGINQTITTGAGVLNLSADVAAFKIAFNADAGLFSILLDGSTVASDDLGPINAGQTLRATLMGSISVTAGTHDLEILVTRPFTTCGDGCTPNQYVTDITANMGGTVPEPASWAMMVVGTSLLGAALRRRRLAALAA